MGYDVRVVFGDPDVDTIPSPTEVGAFRRLVDSDSELAWSQADGLLDEEGRLIEPMIEFRGASTFVLDASGMSCKNPSDAAVEKLARMAAKIGGRVLGDDGEEYRLVRGLFGRERVVRIALA